MSHPHEHRTFSPNSYFDDLQVGDRYVTSARTITETDLVVFSGLSGDYSGLHTDEVAASNGPFGRRISHGALTLSIATGLEYRLMGGGQDRIVAFYGIDRLRYTAPVFIGDTVHLVGEITDLTVKDDRGGVVTIRQALTNQDGVVVMVLDKRVLNLRHSEA